MRPSNLELACRVYALAGDYLSGERQPAESELAELVAPDFLLVPSSALSSGSSGPYRGVRGLLDWMDDVSARWSSFEMRVEEFIDAAPNSVVARARTVASRPGGQGYAVSVGQVWRFRDGALVEIASFGTLARALQYAGIGPEGLPARRPDDA